MGIIITVEDAMECFIDCRTIMDRKRELKVLRVLPYFVSYIILLLP